MIWKTGIAGDGILLSSGHRPSFIVELKQSQGALPCQKFADSLPMRLGPSF